MPNPLPLQYARATPRWPKRLWRIFFIALLTILALTAWRRGPYLWRQAHILYWQRQCLNFSLPPSTVVYEEDPTAAAILLRQPDYFLYVLGRGQDFSKPGPIVHAAAFIPSCWRTFGRPYAFALTARRANPSAAIFLHERISPAGHHRLICIEYFPGPGPFQPAFIAHEDYDSSVFVPATWTHAPTQVGQRPWAISVFLGFASRPPLIRVFAGQIDPNDSAHFTVRYQMWGHEDILDGRLLDNDTVTLTPRHPPERPAK